MTIAEDGRREGARVGVMADAQEARLELGQWFVKMLEEIDEDNVIDSCCDR